MLLAAPAMAHGAGAEQDASLAGAPVTPAPSLSPSRVIVEWAPSADGTERRNARESAEVQSVRILGAPEFQLVRIAPGQSMDEALASLRGDPSVLVAERDGLSAPNSIPNDTRFGELWGLRNLGGAGIDGFSGAVAGADIDAPAAWDRTVGSPSIVIADIDTGYRFDSPDLGPVAWTNPNETANGLDDDGNGIVDDLHGADFVGPSADASSLPVDGDPTDDNVISGGHGVHTAGTMGAKGNDGFGITGVAQNVRIMPLRVCANSAANANEARCPTSSQIAAINYAGNKGARAANMSLGGTTFNQALVNALAANPLTLFVISAGNDSANNELTHHYPCDYTPQTQASPPVAGAVDNIVCVAATNQADGLAGFSDWGATSVDLGAPGTETLSTFPATEDKFSDDFETNNFAAGWSNSGSESFGRASAGDGPLTSFGMNDSPGNAPAASSSHVATSTGVAVPAGTGACTLNGRRYRSGGSGGSFFYEILSDGSQVFFNTTSTATGGSALVPFHTETITGLGGHTVSVRFGFTSGPSPTASDGIWLDDIKLTCNAPLSTPPGYEFLQGTSMAAPHVTGAAGLLFSRVPSATVSEVRKALLTGVDTVASLAGKTVTGGRLNVSTAMSVLEDTTAPAAPHLTGTVPNSPADENHPKIVGTAEAGSTVRIYKGTTCSGAPVATGTATELGSPGIAVSVPDNSSTQLTATATDAGLNASACSNPIEYTEKSTKVVVEQLPPGIVEQTEAAIRNANPAATIAPLALTACTVPKLSGKTLGQATAALGAAHCTLGTVTKPKGHKPGPLVVKSSTPAAGAHPAGGKVNLTLAPKPKPKKHHH
jgi:subtilisin family serine protease